AATTPQISGRGHLNPARRTSLPPPLLSLREAFRPVPHTAVRRLFPVVVAPAASPGAAAPPATAADGGRPLSATLTGPVEIPPGDPGGSGTAEFQVNIGQGQICFSLSVQHLSTPVIAAHIHVAPAGQAGPIVVPLADPVTGTS